jgi:hypothetical protein
MSAADAADDVPGKARVRVTVEDKSPTSSLVTVTRFDGRTRTWEVRKGSRADSILGPAPGPA